MERTVTGRKLSITSGTIRLIDYMVLVFPNTKSSTICYAKLFTQLLWYDRYHRAHLSDFICAYCCIEHQLLYLPNKVFLRAVNNYNLTILLT